MLENCEKLPLLYNMDTVEYYWDQAWNSIEKADIWQAIRPIAVPLSQPVFGYFNCWHVLLVAIWLTIKILRPDNEPRVNTSQIVLKTEKDAYFVKKRLETQSFKAMAHKYSTCVSKMTFGELGFVKRGDMPKEIEIVLFDKPIEIGKVAGPIKTKMGYHLIVVHERINFEKINIPNGL